MISMVYICRKEASSADLFSGCLDLSSIQVQSTIEVIDAQDGYKEMRKMMSATDFRAESESGSLSCREILMCSRDSERASTVSLAFPFEATNRSNGRDAVTAHGSRVGIRTRGSYTI